VVAHGQDALKGLLGTGDNYGRGISNVKMSVRVLTETWQYQSTGLQLLEV